MPFYNYLKATEWTEEHRQRCQAFVDGEITLTVPRNAFCPTGSGCIYVRPALSMSERPGPHICEGRKFPGSIAINATDLSPGDMIRIRGRKQ